MKRFAKLVAASCLAFGASICQAGSVEFGDYDGSIVKTVTGVWSYNEKVEFSSSGTYKLNFADLNFGDQFDYVGAMISTSTQKLASITFTNGQPSSMLPLEFQVGEQEYWLSIFAFTNSASSVGTLGLDIDWVSDVSEVPAPPALILMLSSLLGLGSVFRRRQKTAAQQQEVVLA